MKKRVDEKKLNVRMVYKVSNQSTHSNQSINHYTTILTTNKQENKNKPNNSNN